MMIPGTIDEWEQIDPADPLRWHRVGHPEDSPITLGEGWTFPAYWARRLAQEAAELSEEARRQAFVGDISRQEFMQHLRTDSLADIEAFVRGKIRVDDVTDLATARLCLKRIETGLVTVLKLLALEVRR